MEIKSSMLLSEATPYYADKLFQAAIPELKEAFNLVVAGPESVRFARFAKGAGVQYRMLPRLSHANLKTSGCVNDRVAQIESEMRFPIQKIIFASPEFYRFYVANETDALRYFVTLFDFYRKVIIDDNIGVFLTTGEDRLHNLIPYFIMRLAGRASYLARIVPYRGITLTSDFFGPFTSTGRVVTNDNVDYSEHVRAILGKKVVKDANLRRISDAAMARRQGYWDRILSEFDIFACETANPLLAHEDFRLFSRVLRKISRPLKELRRKYLLRPFLYGKIADAQDYIYFPFHVTEDAQVRLKYPEGYNQYELVRNICKNLPVNYKLLIKEHPDTVGHYSMRELFKLSRLPNCVVVDPKVSSKKILNHAKYVVTINSTVAYEALFFDKVVFALGKTFHDDFPGIVPIKSPSELFGLLSNRELLTSKQREIKRQLQGKVIQLLQSAIPFNYQHYWGGTEMYRAVVELLKKYRILNSK